MSANFDLERYRYQAFITDITGTLACAGAGISVSALLTSSITIWTPLIVAIAFGSVVVGKFSVTQMRENNIVDQYGWAIPKSQRKA